jgi:hypothetical protein
MAHRQPESLTMMCVVLALRKDGELGAATTTGEFPLWIARDEKMEMRSYPPLGLSART